jgi:hypothetical protein
MTLLWESNSSMSIDLCAHIAYSEEVTTLKRSLLGSGRPQMHPRFMKTILLCCCYAQRRLHDGTSVEVAADAR